MTRLKSFPKQNVSLGTQAESFQEIQAALFRVLEALIVRADADSPLLELPVLQVKCLHVIAQQPAQPMKEIARKLHIELPSLSRVVDRLVARGLVERAIDSRNRRITHLALTEKAQAMLAETQKAKQSHLEACLCKLDPAMTAQIISALNGLAAAAEQIPQTAAESPGFAEDPVVQLIARYPRTRYQKRAP